MSVRVGGRSVSTHDLINRLSVVATILVYLVIALLAYWILTPAVPFTSTTHELAYLPANYKVADNVTNFFSQSSLASASAGVGSPQSDWSIQKYQEVGSESNFNVIDITLSKKDQTSVDSFFISEGWVNHSRLLTVEDPRWIGGRYVATDWEIENNTLTLDRKATFGNSTAMIIMIVAVLMITTFRFWTNGYDSPIHLFVTDKVNKYAKYQNSN